MGQSTGADISIRSPRLALSRTYSTTVEEREAQAEAQKRNQTDDTTGTWGRRGHTAGGYNLCVGCNRMLVPDNRPPLCTQCARQPRAVQSLLDKRLRAVCLRCGAKVRKYNTWYCVTCLAFVARMYKQYTEPGPTAKTPSFVLTQNREIRLTVPTTVRRSATPQTVPVRRSEASTPRHEGTYTERIRPVVPEHQRYEDPEHVAVPSDALPERDVRLGEWHPCPVCENKIHPEKWAALTAPEE